MSLIHTERTKLTASWLNDLGIASVAVGGIGFAVAYVVGTVGAVPVLVNSGVWIAIGLGLHLAGRLTLGGLRS